MSKDPTRPEDQHPGTNCQHPPPHFYAGKGHDFDNRHKYAYAVNGKWDLWGGGHLPLIFKTVKQNGFYCGLKKEGVIAPCTCTISLTSTDWFVRNHKKNLKPH